MITTAGRVKDKINNLIQQEKSVPPAPADVTIRMLVGAIALVTLIAMLVGQFIIDGPIGVRGSISAYYHSGLRDLFVGSLWAIGTLLIAYKAARPRGWEFWVSLVAGVSALGLATFPTGRPGLPHNTPSCLDASSLKVECTWLQDWLHEDTVETLHHTFTGGFGVFLAIICLVFALSEKSNRAKWVFWSCLVLIALAVLEFILGSLVGFRAKMYVAEWMFMIAFAGAWFWKARSLLYPVLNRRNATRPSRVAFPGV